MLTAIRERFKSTLIFFSEFDGVEKRDLNDSIADYQIYRHDPGKGCWPLTFAIARSVSCYLFDVQWRRRVGLACFRLQASCERSTFLYVTGVHGAHTDLEQTWEDIAYLLRKVRSHDNVAIVGDLNVNILDIDTGELLPKDASPILLKFYDFLTPRV